MDAPVGGHFGGLKVGVASRSSPSSQLLDHDCEFFQPTGSGVGAISNGCVARLARSSHRVAFGTFGAAARSPTFFVSSFTTTLLATPTTATAIPPVSFGDSTCDSRRPGDGLGVSCTSNLGVLVVQRTGNIPRCFDSATALVAPPTSTTATTRQSVVGLAAGCGGSGPPFA